MERLIYENNALDCNDTEWAKEHEEVNKFNKWDGIIEINAKTEHSIIASACTRGRQFTITLNRYFYSEEFCMESWCYYIPNFKFGGEVNFNKLDMYKEIESHLPNKVDAISLTNAILKLLEDAITKHQERIAQLMKNR